jgi:hypothetical protein
MSDLRREPLFYPRFSVISGYVMRMGRPPKPGGAVIQPRLYTDVPKKFGQTTSRLAVTGAYSPQQGAAELQHALVNNIREHLLDRGMDLRGYCNVTELPSGLTADRFYRLSTGEGMMGLTDLMYWASVIPDFAQTVARLIAEIVPEDASGSADRQGQAND